MNRQFGSLLTFSVRMPQTGWFKLTKIYYLAILDTGSLKLELSTGVLFWWRWGESALRLLLASVLVMFLGIYWFIDLSLQSLPHSSHGFLPVSVSLFCCKDTIMLDSAWLDLSLITIAKNTISKIGHIPLGVLVLRFECIFPGNTIQQ